eukprot:SAG11_NODE_29871_length_306_cov_0.903382_1_plen_65_part_10
MSVFGGRQAPTVEMTGVPPRIAIDCGNVISVTNTVRPHCAHRELRCAASADLRRRAGRRRARWAG